MQNWPEGTLKGEKNTKSFDHLLCACYEVILYIFTSTYDLMSFSPLSASLAASVLHHGRADISG